MGETSPSHELLHIVQLSSLRRRRWRRGSTPRVHAAAAVLSPLKRCCCCCMCWVGPARRCRARTGLITTKLSWMWPFCWSLRMSTASSLAYHSMHWQQSSQRTRGAPVGQFSLPGRSWSPSSLSWVGSSSLLPDSCRSTSCSRVVSSVRLCYPSPFFCWAESRSTEPRC